ncbi:MAG: hypothetical protein AB9891_07765 [Anaerolineaceae bacterium]
MDTAKDPIGNTLKLSYQVAIPYSDEGLTLTRKKPRLLHLGRPAAAAGIFQPSRYKDKDQHQHRHPRQIDCRRDSDGQSQIQKNRKSSVQSGGFLFLIPDLLKIVSRKIQYCAQFSLKLVKVSKSGTHYM